MLLVTNWVWGNLDFNSEISYELSSYLPRAVFQQHRDISFSPIGPRRLGWVHKYFLRLRSGESLDFTKCCCYVRWLGWWAGRTSWPLSWCWPPSGRETGQCHLLVNNILIVWKSFEKCWMGICEKWERGVINSQNTTHPYIRTQATCNPACKTLTFAIIWSVQN